MIFNEETKEKSLQYAKTTCQNLIKKIEEQHSKNNLTTKDEFIEFIQDYFEMPQNKYDIKEAYMYVNQPDIITYLNSCFEEINKNINETDEYIDKLGIETSGLSILSNELKELADYSIQNQAEQHFISTIKHEFQNYILKELDYILEAECNQSIRRIIKFNERYELRKEIEIQYNDHPEYIDVTGWDVSNIDDMSWLFTDLEDLEEIKGLSTWDVSNVKDMGSMFEDCGSLKKLDLSNWDVSNVETMEDMFSGCTELEQIKGIENWNVSNVEIMDGMFAICNNLKELDLSNWNTNNVKDMVAMFESCSHLETLDLTNWNVSNVEDMAFMFHHCTELEQIKGIEDWDTSNVKQTYDIFYDCEHFEYEYGEHGEKLLEQKIEKKPSMKM